MKFQNLCLKAALAGFLVLCLNNTASATSIGMLTDGWTENATGNLNYYTSQHANTTWAPITDTGFAGMNTQTLRSTFDILIVPWRPQTPINLDWGTVIRPYLEAGGSVLWEDPFNIDDLNGSGAGVNTRAGQYVSGATVESPFGDNGAASYFHPHFGIASPSEDWDIWNRDPLGNIHGIAGEFGTMGGRMVIAVNDNLWHAEMWNPNDSDHYQLFINEINWLKSGTPNTPVPEPSTILMVLIGLGGLAYVRKAH